MANPTPPIEELRESKGPSAEHLQIALAKCEAERDEAVNWSALVDRHGTDDFDALAEAWLAMEPIQRMHQAVGSVFAKWANDEIMTRFRQHMSDIMQTAFVEGCLVGVRAEMALAAQSVSDEGVTAGLELAAKYHDELAARHHKHADNQGTLEHNGEFYRYSDAAAKEHRRSAHRHESSAVAIRALSAHPIKPVEAVEQMREAARAVIADAEEYGILDGGREDGEPINMLAMRAQPLRDLRAAIRKIDPQSLKGEG